MGWSHGARSRPPCHVDQAARRVSREGTTSTGHVCVTHDVLSHAADQDMGEPALSVRGGYDQISAVVIRKLADLLRRVSDVNDRFVRHITEVRPAGQLRICARAARSIMPTGGIRSRALAFSGAIIGKTCTVCRRTNSAFQRRANSIA